MKPWFVSSLLNRIKIWCSSVCYIGDVVVLGHGGNESKSNSAIENIIHEYSAKVDRLHKDAADVPNIGHVIAKSEKLLNRIIDKIRTIGIYKSMDAVSDTKFDNKVKYYTNLADKIIKSNEKFIKTENLEEYNADYKHMVKEYRVYRCFKN